MRCCCFHRKSCNISFIFSMLEGGATRIVDIEWIKIATILFITAYYHLLFPFFIHEKRGKTATFSLLARAAAMHTQSSYSCFADSLQLARLYVYIFMCSSQKHKKWKIDALAYIKNWFDRSARVHNAVCAVQRRKRGEKNYRAQNSFIFNLFSFLSLYRRVGVGER